MDWHRVTEFGRDGGVRDILDYCPECWLGLRDQLMAGRFHWGRRVVVGVPIARMHPQDECTGCRREVVRKPA